MKRLLTIAFIFTFFGCEDKDNNDESSNMVGTWSLSNLGEYANADCSGAVDDSGWEFIQFLGMSMTLELKSGGTGTYNLKFEGEEESFPLTWDEDGEICIGGVACLDYELNENSLTLDAPEEAYCEDDMGNETDDTSQSTCEAAGNYWSEASCAIMTFTKD